MQSLMYDSITYKVPFIKILRTGWSVNDAVKDFLINKTSSHIDEVLWPVNYPCSRN